MVFKTVIDNLQKRLGNRPTKLGTAQQVRSDWRSKKLRSRIIFALVTTFLVSIGVQLCSPHFSISENFSASMLESDVLKMLLEKVTRTEALVECEFSK